MWLWDVAINITLYVPLGIFGYLAVSARASRVAAGSGAAGARAGAFGVDRDAPAFRRFADVQPFRRGFQRGGAAVGIAAGALYRVKLQRFLARQGTASLLRPSGALLLLSCWLGYQLFPLFPVWGRTN
jgi:hypothetical protein